ncbi:MAG TPA: 4'-phosphopantetheinyl transferase superfamily protein [Steroidobacteraceae bacterium]
MPGPVEVWFARETLLDDAREAARLATLLDADEHARRNRMAHESGRRRQLLARALQREVLSRYEPAIRPAEWRFERGAHGRPGLAPAFAATGLNFNVAHAAGLVVVAVGRVARLGVDVEALDKRVPIPVARRYFSPPEVAALDALAPEARARRFLRLWTLKEAYLKAVGEGLAGGLDRMTFTLGDDPGITFEHYQDADAARWVFREFVEGAWMLALACLDAGEPPAVFALREYRAGNA